MKLAPLASLVAIPVLVAGAALAPAARTLAQEATPAAELAAAIGGDGVLTNCVDPSFPPMEYFESQDAQQPIGFDIDLVNQIGERLGVQVEHVPTEFTGLLPGLGSGRCDVVASGIYLTAERLETFAAQPYYDTSIVLLAPVGETGIASPEDLDGKTVAVQSGTNYINILNELDAKLKAEGKAGLTIQQYPKQTDAIQQLVVGRADATITQDTEAAFRASAQPGQFEIVYTYPDAQTFGIYYRPDATALGEALKQAVEGMRDDGSLAAIAAAWNLPEAGAQYTEDFSAAATPEATPAS
jgi:polar amino acid transport system substrate-binding protein